MAQTSTIPQKLMTAALLHFEQGVPIKDLDVRRENKDRLARVQHVYWQWMKNPMIDTFQLFKQLIRGQYADAPSEHHAAQKDQRLFEFVVEHVANGSRKMDEAKVRYAAERMITIGMETDNVAALDKGSKRLYEVAGLDKPETEQMEMAKTVFLPPVVTTVASEVDPTKEDVTDEQAKLILKKYGAYVDEKRTMVEERVDSMMARREGENICHD